MKKLCMLHEISIFHSFWPLVNGILHKIKNLVTAMSAPLVYTIIRVLPVSDPILPKTRIPGITIGKWGQPIADSKIFLPVF